MIRSMTAYSSARVDEGGYSLSITLKSTNHRYLDAQVRLPPGLDFLDPEIRRLLKQQVRRGHVEVAATFESRNGAGLQLDRKMLEAYLKTCQRIRQEYHLAAEPDVVALLRIPGIVSSASEMDEAERGRIKSALERCMAPALARFNEMREREGSALKQDLNARLKTLEELAEEIDHLSVFVAPAFRNRLENRVRDLLGSVEIEPARIAQEIAFLAMRSDITEELTRFKSHVAQAIEILNEDMEAGKRLDFLLQEMNREANTMLSKTTDAPEVGLRIQDAAIAMKAEIEKVREQVQNIE